MKNLNLEYFKEKGRKGGLATKKKYGRNHFSKLAKKRWRAIKAKKLKV